MNGPSRDGSETGEPLLRLSRADLPEDTLDQARFLLGCLLVHDRPEGRCAGRIVEVEAYLPGDRACHAYRGPTKRNASLFLERGHAYVHWSYGIHLLLNVSAGPAGVGSGILLRALEPTLGLEIMRARRPGVPDRRLARGPGCLTRALAIKKEWDGRDLCAPESSLWLARASSPPERVVCGPRVGIREDAHLPLRFYVPGHPSVSAPTVHPPQAVRRPRNL